MCDQNQVGRGTQPGANFNSQFGTRPPLGMPGATAGPMGQPQAFGANPGGMQNFRPPQMPGGMPGATRPPYVADPPGGFFPGADGMAGAPPGAAYMGQGPRPGDSGAMSTGLGMPPGATMQPGMDGMPGMGIATKFGAGIPGTPPGGPTGPGAASPGVFSGVGPGQGTGPGTGPFDINGLSSGPLRQDVGQAAAMESIMGDLRAQGLSGDALTQAFNAQYGNQWGAPGGQTPALQAEIQKRMAANGFKGNIATTQYAGPTGRIGGGPGGQNEGDTGGGPMRRDPNWRAPPYDWNAQKNGLPQPHNPADWANKFLPRR